MRRPTVNDSADIELIPFGRSHEQHERQLDIKRQGRDGLKGCLFMGVLFALIVSFLAGLHFR